MGYDLIGYHMVGPRKFSKRAVAAAKRHALAIRTVALDMNLASITTGGARYRPESAYHRGLIKHIDRVLNNGALGDIEDFDTDTDALVESFLDIWSGGDRDVAVRDFPRDRRKQIVFVGGGSWGDSPSEGYDEIQKAEAFGILDALGVE